LVLLLLFAQKCSILKLFTGEAEIEIAHCVSLSGMTSGKEDWKGLGGNLAPDSLFFIFQL
jgi:hypothetical protein